MVDLICRYCGKKFTYGGFCPHSPTKRHVAVYDGQHCIYCGKKFIAGGFCRYSPNKKHRLDD